MDFGKLSASEKMVVYASLAVVVLSIYSLAYGWGGLMALPLIGGLGALAIVFLPQMSPNSSLPGSRGTLLLIAGGGAALFWTLNTLVWLGYIFNSFDEVDTWIYLVGFAASLWLGWQVWQAFQAEGGTFRLGSASGASAAAPAGAADPTSSPAAPAATETTSPPPPPPASEPMASETSETAADRRDGGSA